MDIGSSLVMSVQGNMNRNILSLVLFGHFLKNISIRVRRLNHEQIRLCMSRACPG
jgi:hypothetical protein